MGTRLRMSDGVGASAPSRPVPREVLSADGFRVVWAAAGTGSPIVACPGLVSHLLLDWADGPMGRFHRAVAADHRLIRYDRPGAGLSDPRWAGFDLERELDVLGRVIDATGEERVALFCRNMAAQIGMAFAALNPARVSHLIVFGGSSPVVATDRFPDGLSPALADAVERLVRAEWGVGSLAVAQIMLPDVTPEAAVGHAEYQRMAASGDAVADLIAAHSRLDIGDLVERIAVPTLFLHRRDDRTVSSSAARRTAGRVPGAVFQELPGSANLPYYGDQQAVIEAIRSFVDPVGSLLTSREAEVIRHAASGLSNREIATALFVSPHTVARHLANVFLKLGVNSRGAAVAAARKSGLVRD